MKNLKSILAILVMAVMITACQKEVQGPAGKDGTDGINGTNGTDGSNGTNGSANIQEGTYSVSSGTWLGPYLAGAGGKVYYKDLSVSFITQDILDHGVVMVFRKGTYSNGAVWYTALPYSEVYTSSSTRLWSFEYSITNVRILIQNTDNGTHGYGGATFKVVAIDGSGKAANPNLDWSNYNAVKNAFKLQD